MSGALGTPNEGEEVKRVVEKILDKRVVGREIQYFIKWRGFEDDDDKTWEPEETLGCPELIAEFDSELNQKENKKSLKVASHLVEKDAAAGHASNSASGCNQNPELNFEGTGFVDGLGKGFGGLKKTKRIGNGKELETGSTSSTVTKELEPLLNSLILTNLFRMVPHEVLATCRLVCKTWKENSLMAWRSSSTLSFLYLNQKVTMTTSRYSNSDSHLDNATTLNEFLEFWDQECRITPYRSFLLKDWKLFEPSVGKAKSPASLKGRIDQFWNLIGVNITSLTLSYCEFSDAAELRKILFQSCPNLETLVVDNCKSRGTRTRNTFSEPLNMNYIEPVCGEHFKIKSLSVYITPTPDRTRPNDDAHKWEFPITRLELLSHFPKLTSFRISYTGGLFLECYIEDARKWINAIRAIRRHDPFKLSLKHFQIEQLDWFRNETISQEYFNLVKELNTPLKSVCIDLGPEETVGDDRIKELILFHGKTLEKIATYGGTDANMPYFGFPYGVELDNLQTLYMAEHLCQNMEFIKYTPNLEKLGIFSFEEEETRIVSNTFEHALENFRLEKLKKLELYCNISAADLIRLTKWLPNIMELKLSRINDAKFSVVCEQWSQLVHMHMEDALGLTDAGIIGTGPRVSSGEKNGMKGIARLTGLKCFKITQRACSHNQLTDKSGIDGFLKMPQLQILHFNRSMFGNATKRALCAKIPNCKLHDSRFSQEDCPCCAGDTAVSDCGDERGLAKIVAPGITCDWNCLIGKKVALARLSGC